MNKNENVKYQPVLFIIITFGITWACAFFMSYQTILDSSTNIGTIVLTAVDFLESASPLIAAMILLSKPLFRERKILQFILGDKPRLLTYGVVALLFLYQFLTFYLFPMEGIGSTGIVPFIGLWASQVLLGGGMEEGGWRGYLQQAFEKRLPAVVSVIGVSIVWALWHLPYFFLPGTFLSGNNFLFYMVTTTATAFTLTAIYKMTKSVLLCTLFHGWQNAIVMSVPADMGHPGFLIMFGIQTVVSIILCIYPIGATTKLHMIGTHQNG